MSKQSGVPATRILVVEDDPAILIGLQEKLRIEGYEVLTAMNGEAACESIADNPPELVILDLMLPRLDGFGVLRWLRKTYVDLPVLILSAKGREQDKVMGLKAGADDYLAKPFGLSELMARIEALLRRARGGDRPIRFGDVIVDVCGRRVTRDNREVTFSKKEFEVLLFLIRHRNRTVSREQIVDGVWGLSSYGTPRAVDFHILNLRKKLEQDPHRPRHLITRHGVGYELTTE